MIKRFYLIHGWGGSQETAWFIWLRKELEKNGFEVHSPDMPDTTNPK